MVCTDVTMIERKQRLLAVRVSTATEEPDESAALIAAALFGPQSGNSGSGGGKSKSPRAPPTTATAAASSIAGGTSVTWHYQAVSHGRLQFEPAINTTTTTTIAALGTADDALPVDYWNRCTTRKEEDDRSGGASSVTNGVVLDVSLPDGIAFQGSYMQDWMDAIWNATEVALSRPVRQVADAVVFCLPTGSWLDHASDNESSWTAFSYLWEPVRTCVCGVWCLYLWIICLSFLRLCHRWEVKVLFPLSPCVSPHWLLIFPV
jgi:hypothetical protein